MYTIATVQSLTLGRQDRAVWHYGKRVIRIKSINKTYPYKLTYSDGSQNVVDAAEIITQREKAQ